MSEEGQGQGFSAWGWIGKAKAAVQDASSKIQENVQVPPAMGGIGGVFDKIMSMEDAATADESDYLPWATPPPKWVAKPLEWEALSKGLVENEAYDFVLFCFFFSFHPGSCEGKTVAAI